MQFAQLVVFTLVFQQCQVPEKSTSTVGQEAYPVFPRLFLVYEQVCSVATLFHRHWVKRWSTGLLRGVGLLTGITTPTE